MKTLSSLFILILSITLPAQAQFGLPETLLVNNNGDPAPNLVFTVDLNLDGLDDVVVKMEEGPIEVYLQTSIEDFQLNQTIDGIWRDVATNDVNNDGWIDLIALNANSEFTVFLNDGTANFEAEYSDNTDFSAINITIGDADGDGFKDLYFYGVNTIIKRALNQGDGTFDSPSTVFDETSSYSAFGLNDLNNDGIEDAVFVEFAFNAVSVAYGETDGLFALPEVISTPLGFGSHFTFFDFDNDGDQDIVDAVFFTGHVRILEQEDGAFSELLLLEEASQWLQVTTGDLNDDGLDDVVLAGTGLTEVGYLPNLGNGAVGDLVRIKDGFGAITGLAIADLNQDGELDFVSADLTRRILSINYGNQFTEQVFSIEGANYDDLDFGDVDNDGDQDLLTVSTTDGPILFFNDGNESFTQRRSLPGPAELTFGELIDLDGDMDLDMLFIGGNETGNAGFVIENNGDGTFNRAIELEPAAQGIVASDIDGDGDLEIVTASFGVITVLEQVNMSNFVAVESFNYSDPFIWEIELEDVNQNGFQDMVVSSLVGNRVSIYPNLGSFNFGSEFQFNDESELGAAGIDVVDFNEDGLLDLVYVSSTTGQLFWRFNLGEGQMSNAILLGQNEEMTTMLHVFDMESDGDLDVGVNQQTSHDPVLFINSGNLQLDEGLHLLNESEAANMPFDFTDVDVDGQVDYGWVDVLNDRIIWLNAEETAGCTDPAACNYNELAQLDNGACCYDFCGCTNPDACNYDELASCDDNTCSLPGCTDPLACNYDDQATCEGECFYNLDVCGVCGGDANEVGCSDIEACNYSPNADCTSLCVFPGCTDPMACNYDSFAGCDNGSCSYESTLSGFVFQDLDGDMLYDNDNVFNLEPGLNNWQVEIIELNWIGFTNDDGYFVFTEVPFGEYTLSIEPVEGEWGIDDPVSQPIQINECPESQVLFPLSWEGDLPVVLTATTDVANENIDCQFGMSLGLWIENSGGEPLNGQLVMNFDEDLTYISEGVGDVSPTIINAGMVSWELNGFPLAGEELSFVIHLNSPGVEFIGEVYPIDISLILVDGEGETYIDEQWELQPEVLCAYDPNDKYTEYPGYTENHFVLKEEEMEYRIRFQNTGNAPAQQVVIRDTLDIAHLDLDSFHPVFGSHDFTTTVQPNGAVAFTFADIQLPDSTCCFLESQGFVVYRITPREDAEHGDVITNTAHIFFDANPAIITNTTFHTIYECTNELAAFELTDDPVCYGTAMEAMNDGMYIEEYSWTLDGDEVGAEADLLLEGLESGSSTLELTVSNPLCVANASSTFTVLNELEIFIQQNGNQLYYAGFESGDFQWFLNGEAIEGATEPSIEITEDGTYHLELINTQGCIGVSGDLDVIFDSISELGIPGVNVYPNPVQDFLTIEFSDASLRTIELYSEDGKLIQSQMVNTSTYYLDMQELASGVYTLSVVGEGSVRVIK